MQSALKVPLQKRIRSSAVLFLVSAIWGSSYVVQRIAASHYDPFMFNGIRFLVASLLLLLLNKFSLRYSKQELVYVIFVGILLFLSVGLQQIGLAYTTAGNAGFLSGLYVVFVPILVFVIWRNKILLVNWIASILALAGFYMLSAQAGFTFNPGDVYEVIGALIWAIYVILLSKLPTNIKVLNFAVGQYAVCGLMSLIIASFSYTKGDLVNNDYAWTIIFTAVFPVAVGLSLQIYGQKYTKAVEAALILSMETIFAAGFGWLFLEEILNPIQFLGCGLIFSAIILSQTSSYKKENKN